MVTLSRGGKQMTRGVAAGMLVLILAMVAGCSAKLESAGEAAAGGGAGDGANTHPASAGGTAERGKYLVAVLGCGDCHTPLKMTTDGLVPDESMLLAGHPAALAMPPVPKLPEGPWMWVGAGTNTAFAGPWGISYVPNITPDEVTGIGSWTEEIFVKTIRSGKHWGQSRPILPPMPWTSYANMTDEDLKAIFAYLRTVPAVANQAPASEPAGPPAAAGAPSGG